MRVVSSPSRCGERLIPMLAEELAWLQISRCDRRELFRYQRFYRAYPQIVETASPQWIERLKGPWTVRPLTAHSHAEAGFPIVETASPQFAIPGETLMDSLSFSHFAELIEIEDPLKRAFYEIECIRGHWSVRALKRQIATLYFDRSGLSKDKKKLAGMLQKGVETAEPKLAIRDPYIFEFLGLRAKDAVAESDLEASLVENLREFLLELGHGFCLEAQQKSIVIGKTRGFVDLVFYHRILKCHVLVELKVDEFKHEHLGQLNTYVTWYRKHMMAAGDNPPVGLLLCTDKDHALVQYATASVDNHLFVSKYAVELPTKAELERFLRSRHLEILGDA
ncbi:MAG: PDDEXK nuclease domain-containing protein [Nitrospira sp.]|nr:PDDEXK nuclease domain-containing protein [Nitrospira sp.]